MFPELSVDSINFSGSRVTNMTYNAEIFLYNSIPFDEIIFKCTALYAIQWIFLKHLLYRSYVEDINITTQKISPNREDYKFSSLLTLKFNWGTDMIFNESIGCQKFLSPGDVSWLEMGGSAKKGRNAKIAIRKFKGPKSVSTSVKVISNELCRTNLIVDGKNGLLGCRSINRRNLSQNVEDIILLNVTNINEMEVLTGLRTTCKQSVTYERCHERCISDAMQSAAVLYCDFGTHSLSVPIFRINSKLYFDIDKARNYSDLRVCTPKELFLIGISYEFVCKGNYSLYIKGFFWKSRLMSQEDKNNEIKLGNGFDFINEDNEIISRKNISFSSVGIYAISCLAPDWNTSDSWSTTSYNVTVSSEYLVKNGYTTTPGYNMDNIAVTNKNNITDVNNESLAIVQGTRKEADNDFLHGPHRIVTITIISILSALLILVGLGCSVLLAFTIRKIRTQSRQIQQITKEEVLEFEKGNPKADTTALLLPYDIGYEILREGIYIDQQNPLGNGAYGVVFRGTAFGGRCSQTTEVAIKTAKSNVDPSCFRGLMAELKVMIYVGHHENVVNLLGACTQNISNMELFIIMECCQKGELQKFLRSHRQDFKNEVKDEKAAVTFDKNVSSDGAISKIQLMRWSIEIAGGMEYLASKNVIHADLAARNILLSQNLTAKICDFGLSRHMYQNVYVKKNKKAPLPWRWMALESLVDFHFSTESDVWSYGVLLWEIFSLAEVPYPGLSWSEDFLASLVNGYRLGRPLYCSKELYLLLKECWEKDPLKRPTFSDLRVQLQTIFQPHSSTSENPMDEDYTTL